MENKKIQLVIIPGLGDSEEKHWQSFWLKHYDNALKIIQDDWNEPKLDHWLTNLNNTLSKLDGPVILVAHSLAVSLVLHWTTRYDSSHIKGALLVAPADVDSPNHTPDIVRGFAVMPTVKLPFPSVVITSENDPFVSLDRAHFFAEKWGSDFINIGSKGHINSSSNLGYWNEGQVILQQLIEKVTQEPV
jgi:predicted alpha/beta hydrolase family esterase